MEIKEIKEGEVTIVNLAGRLDTTNYIGVEKKITRFIDDGARNLLLDCTDLDYLSSSGLRVVHGLLKKMVAVEGKFALCSLTDNVKKVLKISGFLKLFTIYDTRSEALKELA